ncbi:hypothetical protein Tco_0536743 [Tanacetum coccineum]
MGVDEPKESEVGALVNPMFDSTSSTRGAAELFIVAPSVPYVRDAGMTVIKSTPMEEAETVELDAQVLTRTVHDPASSSSLSSTSGALSSGASILTIPKHSPFQ